MPGARAYLEGVARLLHETGAGPIDIRVTTDDTIGRLSASLRVKGRRRLEVKARLRFFTTPELHAYSFQLLEDDGAHVLRYDNVPHHKELPGFPHHRHRAGKGPEPVIPEPSIRTILGAIEDELEGWTV
ncbi:MAG TPA: DUF6516 family protein [Chloroflexota bacterium]|nr:DUF6516 family protein [Chloroflexota bacterium]